MGTRERVVDAALASFGTRGFEATSLDAIAGELGVRKQTILYYFPTKDALLAGVIDASADELIVELERTLGRAGDGWGRVEAVVRKVFRLAARRPALLGFLREVSARTTGIGAARRPSRPAREAGDGVPRGGDGGGTVALA